MKTQFLVLLLVVLSQQQLLWEECKRDCTLDWLDCVHGCDSINNPQYCHQNCQKYVHSCLDECPMIVCIDKCRVSLEQCRVGPASSVACERHFNDCESICKDTFKSEE